MTTPENSRPSITVVKETFVHDKNPINGMRSLGVEVIHNGNWAETKSTKPQPVQTLKPFSPETGRKIHYVGDPNNITGMREVV